MIAEAEARSNKHIALVRHLREDKDKQAATSDGSAVHLRANIEFPAEALLAVDHGAEGMGLYRTEFLYVDRVAPPTEEEQYEIYRAVVETMHPRPVTLRTFDIGGDKFVSTFQVPPEMNPALGLRAVRLALSRPDVFLDQLRAMVRASAHGDLRIMIPMIASLREFEEVRRLLGVAIREVDARGQKRAAEHSARRHDRSARRGDHGRRLCPRGRLHEPGDQRPRPVRARDRPHQPLARLPCVAVRPVHPAAHRERR